MGCVNIRGSYRKGNKSYFEQFYELKNMFIFSMVSVCRYVFVFYSSYLEMGHTLIFPWFQFVNMF